MSGQNSTNSTLSLQNESQWVVKTPPIFSKKRGSVVLWSKKGREEGLLE